MDRLLCAIDQFESGQSVLDFAAGIAATNDASIRLFHIRELSRMARVMPLETPADAEGLVRDAVLSLGTFGVAAEGRSASALEDHVARRIVEEAMHWDCQAIVLGPGGCAGSPGSRVAACGSAPSGSRLSRCLLLPLPSATGSTGLPGSGPGRIVLRPPAAGMPGAIRPSGGPVSREFDEHGNGRSECGDLLHLRRLVDPRRVVRDRRHEKTAR